MFARVISVLTLISVIGIASSTPCFGNNCFGFLCPAATPSKATRPPAQACDAANPGLPKLLRNPSNRLMELEEVMKQPEPETDDQKNERIIRELRKMNLDPKDFEGNTTAWKSKVSAIMTDLDKFIKHANENIDTSANFQVSKYKKQALSYSQLIFAAMKEKYGEDRVKKYENTKHAAMLKNLFQKIQEENHCANMEPFQDATNFDGVKMLR
jgi:hypothetical protein